MSDPVEMAIIAAVVALVPSILSFFNGRGIARVQSKVSELEVNTNHKMDKLLEANKGQATAEGNLAGRAEARAEAKEDAKP